MNGCHYPEGHSDLEQRGMWPAGEKVGLHFTGAQGNWDSPRIACDIHSLNEQTHLHDSQGFKGSTERHET